MADLVAASRLLREQLADPSLQAVYRQAAVDIITTALEDDRHLWDPAYNDMTPEEREAFLVGIGESLGPVLMRATVMWGLLDGETAADWLKRTRGT
jgi:hypothetical protein